MLSYDSLVHENNIHGFERKFTQSVHYLFFSHVFSHKLSLIITKYIIKVH